MLIDDSIDKCSFNPSFTSIHPIEFKLQVNAIQFHSSQYIHCCCPGLISDIQEFDTNTGNNDGNDSCSIDSDCSDELDIERPLKKIKNENQNQNTDMNSNNSDNIMQPLVGSLWKYLNNLYNTIEETDTCTYIELQPYTGI